MEMILAYNRRVIVLKRHNDYIFKKYDFPPQISSVIFKAKDYFEYLWQNNFTTKRQTFLELDEYIEAVIKGKKATILYEKRTWENNDYYVYTITYAKAGKLILDVKDNVVAIYDRKCGIITQVEFKREGWRNVLALPELDWNPPELTIHSW